MYEYHHRVERTLRQRGIVRNYEQIRSLNRCDMVELLKLREALSVLDLSELDMTGIDIQGLDLRSVWLQGCNLSGAFAGPRIENLGQRLPPNSYEYERIYSHWISGDPSDYYGPYTVKQTDLWDAVLPRADLSGGDFRSANLGKAILNSTTLAGTKFSNADMTDSYLRRATLKETHMMSTILDEAKLEYSQIIGADLSHASLKGVRLLGATISPETKLGGARWDAEVISPLERDRDYDAASREYRYLKEWHDRAGMSDVASQFHYREREAMRKAEMVSIKADLRSAWKRFRCPGERK